MILEVKFNASDMDIAEVDAFTNALTNVLESLKAKDVKVCLDSKNVTRKELIDIARCGISSIMADATEPEFVEGLIAETLGIGLSTVQDIAPDLYAEIAEGIEE